MKAAGMLLLLAGFAIVLCSFILLAAGSLRAVFVLAGIAVELLGLGISFRAHYLLGEAR